MPSSLSPPLKASSALSLMAFYFHFCQLRPLRGALKSAKDEIEDLTQKLGRALKTNKRLQNTAEDLQMELGRKDVELEKLFKER